MASRKSDILRIVLCCIVTISLSPEMLIYSNLNQLYFEKLIHIELLAIVIKTATAGVLFDVFGFKYILHLQI